MRTSHHTHYVIGTGAEDPQKMDPDASRETLDHSAMYILAVAWEDGRWHHVDSYTPERAHRPSTVSLWHKIRTEEAAPWTRAYHESDFRRKKFGAEVTVRMADGTQVSEQLDNPNAHSLGARPFVRDDYVGKLRTLSAGTVEASEVDRFLELVSRLEELEPEEVRQLNLAVPEEQLRLDLDEERVGILA